ncbi:MAG: hypothetical protein HWE10_05835 [Gammaproteobacteria bacterium]|nr:hypothetical protein [Gammaproteobacteria bacterium]
MFIFKIITYVAGAITLGLAGYLYKVLDESGYLEQVAAIPADDIMAFHIFAAVVIVWLVFGLIMKMVSRVLLIALLVLTLGIEGTFLGLNLNGSIVEQSINVDELLEQGKDLVDDIKDSL